MSSSTMGQCCSSGVGTFVSGSKYSQRSSNAFCSASCANSCKLCMKEPFVVCIFFLNSTFETHTHMGGIHSKKVMMTSEPTVSDNMHKGGAIQAINNLITDLKTKRDQAQRVVDDFYGQSLTRLQQFKPLEDRTGFSQEIDACQPYFDALYMNEIQSKVAFSNIIRESINKTLPAYVLAKSVGLVADSAEGGTPGSPENMNTMNTHPDDRKGLFLKPAKDACRVYVQQELGNRYSNTNFQTAFDNLIKKLRSASRNNRELVAEKQLKNMLKDLERTASTNGPESSADRESIIKNE